MTKPTKDTTPKPKGKPPVNANVETMQKLWDPHVSSFNFFLGDGLKHAIKGLEPMEMDINGDRLKYRVTSVNIQPPHMHDDLQRKMYPSDCRQAGITYGSHVTVDIAKSFNGSTEEIISLSVGRIPIMVKSSGCNLHGMNAQQLVEHHEEEHEAGGFFIINGNEKMIRMLSLPRSNYVFAFERPSYVNRGPGYTPFCSQIRCVKPDRTSKYTTLHYLNTGNIMVRFSYRIGEYFIPVGLLLKALLEATDRQIYEKIVAGDLENTFVTERVDVILSSNRDYAVTTQSQALKQLGTIFKFIVSPYVDRPAEEVGQILLDSVIFVHMNSNAEKFELLVYMIQKLLAFVNKKILPDNPDSPSNHEIYQSGHCFLNVFQQKLRDLVQVSAKMLLKIVNSTYKPVPYSEKLLRQILQREANDIASAMLYLLSTGNVRTKEMVELPQQAGLAIAADRLNFLRYLSHFRGVHRGAFFAEMKTTTIRKLMPESWGFLCCVHTPDGAPCGLLNHLTSNCIVTHESHTPKARLVSLLGSLGMSPVSQTMVFPPSFLTIMVDGHVVGKIPKELAASLVQKIRLLKTAGTEEAVPPTMEIGLIPPLENGQYPGVFIFTTAARMMRPVAALSNGKTELIGSFEQVYMDIAVRSEDIKSGITTHQELHPTQIFSVVASLTPFSEFNQSPRNMYQCQMAKQTMGTPYHAFPYRTDGGKVYRIQHPQKPLVRTFAQEKYTVNDYPHGCNAVVAVISYTGYDMEDAMIINKSSQERGWGNGSVYTTVFIDIVPKEAAPRERARYYMSRDPEISEDQLDDDGLPHVGLLLKKGDPFYSYVIDTQMIYKVNKFKYKEDAYVENVTIISNITSPDPTVKIQQISIRLRFNRNPVIGDKFSSRHGQKGVLSQLWPEINMPFAESGLRPDCIINPHAFPSRMTIGMLVESMAGKAGALHGFFQDGTAFQFDEKNTAADYFGQQLVKAGYNYYGNEPMYSGTSGTELHADIYIGVVYYQRLRHMVKDKFQVRSTGKVNKLTMQPVKGRKAGGGIRFGEMERDSLLAHGTSYLLLDRLMNCSDYSRVYACKQCGSFLSTIQRYDHNTQQKNPTCKFCDSKTGVVLIAVPFVLRYVAAELASVNIKMTLEIKQV